MPKKRSGGGKGKGPRADKAPPTPVSADPQQQNSALPSPAKTPPASPSARAVDLPAVSPAIDAEPAKDTAQADSGVAEHQLPTPREPDVPLPTVAEGDGPPSSQQEPAVDAEANGTEPQPSDSVSANVDAPADAEELKATDIVGAGDLPDTGVGTGDLLEAGEPLETGDLLQFDQPAPTPANETEPAANTGVEDDPTVGNDLQTVEEIEMLSQPTEESDKPLPPPPIDEAPGDEASIEENPQDTLLQTSEVPLLGEDQDLAVAVVDPGDLHDLVTLPDWSWGEESSSQQFGETLIDVAEPAGTSAPEAFEDPAVLHDPSTGEISAEVAPISNEEQEHIDDLIEVVPPSDGEADESPLLDATEAAPEENHVDAFDWAGESEQFGDPVEQPLGDWDELAAFETPEIASEEVMGDPIEPVPMDDHLVDFGEDNEPMKPGEEGDPIEPAPTNGHSLDFLGENHELDITEGEIPPVEQAPVDNHAMDTDETHELDITEAAGDPLEEVPTDNDHTAVNTDQSTELEITEGAGDSFEQVPASDDVVDAGQNPGMEINADDLSASREEDPSLPEVRANEVVDGQTAEDVDPNVDAQWGWGVDETPEDIENVPPQPEGETTLAHDDEPIMADNPAEGASHSEGTTAIDNLESPEHKPEVLATDMADSNGSLEEPTEPPGPQPDVDEGQPVGASEETDPGKLQEESVEVPPNDEGGNPPPPSIEPAENAEEMLQSEVDINEEAYLTPPEQIEPEVDPVPEALEDAASLQPADSETHEESHGLSSAPLPTDPVPETEQIPPLAALDDDLNNPPADIEPAPAPPLEEQPVEVMGEIGEVTETEALIDTQVDELGEAPPAIQLNDTSVESPTNGVAITGQETSLPALTAQDVATPEIVAISEMFGTMRAALLAMTSAFDKLGVQTERMAANSLHIKAAEQLAGLQAALGVQIARQKSEIDALRLKLQSKIKQAAEEKIRAHLRDVIKEAVKVQVEEKVRAQMAIQIPDELRQQVISHQRKIIQVKTDLHNSEARMYNALQITPGARLRPLLRPLPTPEQSPVVINLSRSSSMGNTTLGTPRTAFPSGPAPTPIRRSVSNSLRTAGGLETVPPTPSKFFPRDLTALFALSQDEARRLLREYGLKSTAPSPAIENSTPMRARGLSIVSEEAAEEDPEVHARDMNTFMAHIGVPFLMIPPPKEKPGEEMPPLSSRSRRKMLTPLIIK